MLNVALSSRTLYHLSRRFIYRDIHLTFNRSRRDINGRLIRQLLANHDLSSKVQQLRILWAPSAKLQPGEGSKEEFELLGQLLPKLTGLRAFVWDAQYPILSWLLEALQRHHPKCRLYNHHPASQDSARTLSHLRASPCLFSLDVTLAAGQFEAHHELHRILITASNLTDLTVTSPWSSSNVLPILKQGDSERLRLRSLELYGPRLDEFKLLPVVWSMLERLSLDTLLFDPNIIPQLPELRFLKLRVRGHGNTMYLGSMLQGCQKLETLDLTGCLGDFQIAAEGFWKNVAKSLIKLRLHEEDARNRAAEARNRAVAPSRIIELIAAYCPKLHSLSFDLECNGQEWVSSSPHAVIFSKIKVTRFIAPYDAQMYRRTTLVPCPSRNRYPNKRTSTRLPYLPQSNTRQRAGNMEILVAANPQLSGPQRAFRYSASSPISRSHRRFIKTTTRSMATTLASIPATLHFRSIRPRR